MDDTSTKMKLKPQEKLLTLQEYVYWEAQQEDKYEFYNGKVLKMPYARGPHNEITINIVSALKQAVRALDKTYRIFSSDQKIYFPELKVGVYPDAVVVSEAPQYWDDDTLLLVNPLLVVEVLSKSTQRYDRTGKFDFYKTRPSFQEYVLVRQDTYEVEVRHREEANLWREYIYTGLNDSVILKSLEAIIKVIDIYEHISFE